jgi:hypothetical protein
MLLRFSDKDGKVILDHKVIREDGKEVTKKNWKTAMVNWTNVSVIEAQFSDDDDNTPAHEMAAILVNKDGVEENYADDVRKLWVDKIVSTVNDETVATVEGFKDATVAHLVQQLIDKDLVKGRPSDISDTFDSKAFSEVASKFKTLAQTTKETSAEAKIKMRELKFDIGLKLQKAHDKFWENGSPNITSDAWSTVEGQLSDAGILGKAPFPGKNAWKFVITNTHKDIYSVLCNGDGYPDKEYQYIGQDAPALYAQVKAYAKGNDGDITECFQSAIDIQVKYFNKPTKKDEQSAWAKELAQKCEDSPLPLDYVRDLKEMGTKYSNLRVRHLTDVVARLTSPDKDLPDEVIRERAKVALAKLMRNAELFVLKETRPTEITVDDTSDDILKKLSTPSSKLASIERLAMDVKDAKEVPALQARVDKLDATCKRMVSSGKRLQAKRKPFAIVSDITSLDLTGVEIYQKDVQAAIETAKAQIAGLKKSLKDAETRQVELEQTGMEEMRNSSLYVKLRALEVAQEIAQKSVASETVKQLEGPGVIELPQEGTNG